MKKIVPFLTVLFFATGCFAGPAEDSDILKLVEKNPLNITVNGQNVKYCDPNLAQAVELLADIPRPWTVSVLVQKFDIESKAWMRQERKLVTDKKTQMWATAETESRHIGALARVLAASRDPRAAMALGSTLKVQDFPFSARMDAYSALFDYFVGDYDYGLPNEQRHDQFVGNLLELSLPAVDRWWTANKNQLRAQILKNSGPQQTASLIHCHANVL